MATKQTFSGYRSGYKALIGLYPRPYLDEFGEGLEQTFNDLLQERAAAGGNLLGLALWLFCETLASIAKEQGPTLLELLKVFGGLLWALVVAAAMVIASLMGYEDAWWIMLVVHAVVSAAFTLLHRLLQKKGPQS